MKDMTVRAMGMNLSRPQDWSVPGYSHTVPPGLETA